MIKKNTTHSLLIITLVILLTLLCVASVSALSVKSASGKINADPYAYIRSKASVSSEAVGKVKDNESITIVKEVFTKAGSTAKTNKWYKITYKKKSGYVRADLVDSIKYTSVAGKTTDSLNYRNGPSTKFSSKGTLKKGAGLTIVLTANVKGSDTVWYKIKKDSKYYYVIKKYTKLVASDEADSSASKEEKPPLTLTLTGETLPTIVGKGNSFVLRGLITASETISTAEFGIMTTEAKWVSGSHIKKTVSNMTFDISTIDNDIKFGKLATGTYYYRGYVTVSGKKKTVINQKFKVIKLKGPALLVQTAVNLAWPEGTLEEQYDKANYPETAAPTANYQAVAESLGYTGGLDDCSRFIRTVIVSSGYDKDFPKNIWEQWDYLATSEKWTKVATTGENYSVETDLESGDVLIYQKADCKDHEGWHVCMYVVSKTTGKGCLAEASATQNKYGFINTKITKIFHTDYAKYAVYRAAS